MINVLFRDKFLRCQLLEQRLEIVLPSYKSRCMERDYLSKVAKGKVFTIKKDHYHPFPLRKENIKTDIGTLVTAVQNEIPPDKELGITPEKPPDRLWLLNVLYSLNPNHEIFAAVQATIEARTTKVGKAIHSRPFLKLLIKRWVLSLSSHQRVSSPSA